MKPYGGGGDGLVPGFLNTGRAELGTSRPNPFHEYALRRGAESISLLPSVRSFVFSQARL